ncbi:hypothetical protein AB0758_33090 [Tolypothrix bouteillei VB521301_2]|uniref:hypothetical protein n=1 Tax=Tolypothrix bouteillei TaxID=1246981 RepID=UPI0038B4E5FC
MRVATLKWILIVMVIIVGIFTIPTKIAVAQSSNAQPTWSRFIWPLCGRIKEEFAKTPTTDDDIDQSEFFNSV